MKYLSPLCVSFLLCVSSGRKPFSVKVTEFENYVKTSVYYYDEEHLLRKKEMYNSGGSIYQVVSFHYKDKKWDTITLEKIDKYRDRGWIYGRVNRFHETYGDTFLRNGIKVKFPELIAEEVMHMADILVEGAENKTIINGNEKITSTVEPFGPVRFFSYAIIGDFVWMDDVIESYEYSVKDSYLQWEKLLLNKKRVFEVSFSYNEDKTLSKVSYEVTSPNGDKKAFRRMFKYEKL